MDPAEHDEPAGPGSDETIDDDVAAIAARLAPGARAVVFTGAGVSTGSGLPDFRSATGLWTRYDPREMTFQRHVEDADVRRGGWRMRREFLDAEARPNAAHRADGPTRSVLEAIDAGDDDPHCPRCGGILKAATISFGQAMDIATVEQAWGLVDRADLVITAGTSLQVVPAASLVPTAHEMGVPPVICNAEPTPYDGLAQVVSRGRVEQVLPAVVALLRATA